MKKFTTSDRLQQIMSEGNLKQVDILDKVRPYADKYNVKMNKSDISQYVSGKVEPGQKKIYVLSKALGVNEAWLMGYDVIKSTNTLVNISKDELFSLLNSYDKELLKEIYHYIEEILYPSRKTIITWLNDNLKHASSSGQNYEMMTDEELRGFYDEIRREKEGD